MTSIEIALFLGSGLSLLFGVGIGYKIGVDHGFFLGKAKEMVHFTVSVEKAFADKSKEELNEMLTKIGIEYDKLVKKDK